MPDIFTLLYKWRKQVALVVLISLAMASVVVFLMPSIYLASSTALPASPLATDKATVFNTNTRELFNSLGQSGDLDKIVGTGQLDTIYLSLVDQYKLTDHYRVSGTDARYKAAAALKENSRITKTEYGELLVQVWSRNKNLSAQLANALMQKLADWHQQLLNENNLSILRNLQKGKRKLEAGIDSINTFLQTADLIASKATSYTARLTALREQALQYEKLESEYQLMVDSRPAALIVVDQARPAIRPDKPKRLIILLATAILSFFFAAWLALLLEKRTNRSR